MYTVDVERMVEMAKKKVRVSPNSNPMGYLILSAMAGIYLGFGICLIFSVGAPFWADGSAGFKLVMGASFGIALTLVIFAGSELFTGNNMVCAIGTMARAITMKQMGLIFFYSFVGNLSGISGRSMVNRSGRSGRTGAAQRSVAEGGFSQNERPGLGTVYPWDLCATGWCVWPYGWRPVPPMMPQKSC